MGTLFEFETGCVFAQLVSAESSCESYPQTVPQLSKVDCNSACVFLSMLDFEVLFVCVMPICFSQRNNQVCQGLVGTTVGYFVSPM